MAFTNGHPKAGGRKRGSRNKRTIAAASRPDALDHLERVVTSTDDPTITPDLRLRAAIALAHFQHSKPAPTRVETFIAPVPFAAPKTVEAAREAILELLVRLASGELSIEAFDAIVGGLKAYLGDKAAEQQKILDRLFEDAVRENEK